MLLPGEQQLIIGMMVGLTLCALFRWTPFVRDFFAAVAAAALVDLIINEPTHRGIDLARRATRLPDELLSYPHFSLGVALGFASVLAALHVMR
jgi:hypothetical protein